MNLKKTMVIMSSMLILAGCKPTPTPTTDVEVAWTTREANLQDRNLGKGVRLPAYGFEGRKIDQNRAEEGYIPRIGANVTTEAIFEDVIEGFLDYVEELLTEEGEVRYEIIEDSGAYILVELVQVGEEYGQLVILVEEDEDYFLSMTSYVSWLDYPTTFINSSFVGNKNFPAMSLEMPGLSSMNLFGSGLGTMNAQILVDTSYDTADNAAAAREAYGAVLEEAGFVYTQFTSTSGEIFYEWVKGSAHVQPADGEANEFVFFLY